MEIKQIIGDNGYYQNTYLISTNNTSILIDCGASLSAIKSALSSSINLNRIISGIFLTHTHFDHIWSLKDAIREFNCPVYVCKNCTDFIFDKIKNASTFFADFSAPSEKDGIHFEQIENKKDIVIGDITITPLHTPGHSKCSMCFVIDDNLFCGDTVLYGSTGRTDLWGGNEYELETSLTKIKSLNFTTAYTGHGQPLSKAHVNGIIGFYD